MLPAEKSHHMSSARYFRTNFIRDEAGPAASLRQRNIWIGRGSLDDRAHVVIILDLTALKASTLLVFPSIDQPIDELTGRLGHFQAS